MEKAVKVGKMNDGMVIRKRFGNDFAGNKKLLRKEVKRVRKGEQAMDKMVQDVDSLILRDWGLIKVRKWAEYFEQVLNVDDQGRKYKI